MRRPRTERGGRRLPPGGPGRPRGALQRARPSRVHVELPALQADAPGDRPPLRRLLCPLRPQLPGRARERPATHELRRGGAARGVLCALMAQPRGARGCPSPSSSAFSAEARGTSTRSASSPIRGRDRALHGRLPLRTREPGRLLRAPRAPRPVGRVPVAACLARFSPTWGWRFGRTRSPGRWSCPRTGRGWARSPWSPASPWRSPAASCSPSRRPRCARCSPRRPPPCETRSCPGRSSSGTRSRPTTSRTYRSPSTGAGACGCPACGGTASATGASCGSPCPTTSPATRRS